MNKVIYVKAQFKTLYKDVEVDVPTGEKKKGFLGFGEKDVTKKEIQTQEVGVSDCEIDGELLTEDIDKALTVLNEEGYELVSISPTLSGAYNYKYQAQGVSSSRRTGFFDNNTTEEISGGASFGYGFGFSYTEGVTIIAKKMN